MGRSSGLYLDDELFEFAKKRADAAHAKKLNAYIVSLVEADRDGVMPTPSARDAIVRLAETFHPTIKAALEVQLNDAGDGTPVDQPRLIARFLDSLHHALERREGFNANGTFQLWESEHVLKQAFAGNPALTRFIKGNELNEVEAPAYETRVKQKKVRAN